MADAPAFNPLTCTRPLAIRPPSPCIAGSPGGGLGEGTGVAPGDPPLPVGLEHSADDA